MLAALGRGAGSMAKAQLAVTAHLYPFIHGMYFSL